MPRRIALFAALLVAASAASATGVYKWVDEHGVTNYSNKPPPKRTTDVTMVEDRLSVYTPDAALIEHARRARAAAPVQARATLPPPAAPAQPAVLLYDPCLANDAACSGEVVYGGTPVLDGRFRRLRPVESVAPPGTTAGQVTSGGYTAGFSSSASGLGARAARQPRASFTQQGAVRARHR
jgi:hypothetical protein